MRDVPRSSEAPVTVYIAEDNPILLQGLERALVSHGYRVETAADGLALLGMLESAPLPDVLLLDVMMPGKTGIDVLETVRAERRTAELPVVLITAATEEAVPETALAHPRVDMLLKPFRLNDLLSRLDARVREARSVATGIDAIGANVSATPIPG